MTADITTSTTGAPAPPEPGATLYERIGGRATLERVVPDVMANHLANPLVGGRFRAAEKPIPELVRLAIEFFHTGLSGDATYRGLSMPDAHAGMGISMDEFVAVLDDILAALDQHGITGAEQAELLAILYGMKAEIVGR